MACGHRRWRLRGAAGSPWFSCAAVMAALAESGRKAMVPAPIRITPAAGRAGARDIAAVAKFMTDATLCQQGQVDQRRGFGRRFRDGGIDRRSAAWTCRRDRFCAGQGIDQSRHRVRSEPVGCGIRPIRQDIADPAAVGIGRERSFFRPAAGVATHSRIFEGRRQCHFCDDTAIRRPTGIMLFSTAGIPIWSPIVDRFLASNNLVLRDRPIDVPTPDVPAPSGLNCQRPRGVQDLSRERTEQGVCGRRRFAFRLGHRPPQRR